MTKRLLLISPVARTGLVAKDFNFRLPVLGLLKVAALTPLNWQVTIQDEKVEPLDLDQRRRPGGDHGDDYDRAPGLRNRRPFPATRAESRHGGHACLGPAGGGLGTLRQRRGGRSRGALATPAAGFRQANRCSALTATKTASPRWSICRRRTGICIATSATCRSTSSKRHGAARWIASFARSPPPLAASYRNRPREEVLAELRNLRPFEGRFILKNCVFFVDDNIISNRGYARELLPRLAEFKLKWFSHASMNIAKDPEILRLCQRSGCVGLFIGFETLSDENLRAVGKRTNHPQRIPGGGPAHPRPRHWHRCLVCVRAGRRR